MFTLLTSVSWLAVMAAFVPYCILGWLWFTILLAKPYQASLGRENEVPGKPAPIFIVGPTICALVITVTTAILMQALQIHSVQGAIEFAILIGIGYLVANTVNIAINPNMPRPLYYGAITGAYHLVGIVLVCIILATLS